jgi:poly-gamma-glutamate capsule biosynthesis protein CapA/YwtB (metallophosphatase superfamily)
MPGLKYVLVFSCVLVAASFSFEISGRYALRSQAAANYVWPLRPQRATVIFGGDMMFDRSVRLVTDVMGGDFIFSCIDYVLKGADLVVANLEGPITEHDSISASSTPGDEYNYTFTFPPSTAELLYSHNIRMVNLGNNHILNFGNSGAKSTTQFLKDAGVGYFGQPAVMSAKSFAQEKSAACPFAALCGGWAKPGEQLMQTVSVSIVHGIPLAFINYNEFSFAPLKPLAEAGSNASTTILQIQNARASGYIPIVYTHWGIEYATTSSAYSRELAHSFVDAGAEIVIGSHPHVVEEHEIYNGKYVYYSLGNFIFDQYFSDDVQNGLLLQITFGKGGAEIIKEIPVKLGRDRRTCPATRT